MKYALIFCWLMLFSLTSFVSAQVFVKSDANGANDGSSWTDAYTELSSALTAAQAGDQIWVAAGTYLPGISQTSTFSLNKNLELYGGFAGTETQLTERNDSVNLTILSGDLNGDDIPNDWQTHKTDNVTTVLTVSPAVDSSTIIDGFTIKNGYANTTTALAGGINLNGNPKIRHCILTHNYSLNGGGGIYLNGGGTSGTRISACKFLNNKTNLNGGGIAMFQVFGAKAVVEGCHFEENEATDLGGGIYTHNSNSDILDCTFSSNATAFLGGGIYGSASIGNRNLRIDGCEFDNNTATLGGGANIQAYTPDFDVVISHSQFRNNQSLPLRANYSPSGGGLFVGYFQGGANNTSIIQGCLFENNTARDYGAGMLVENTSINCSTLLDSCIFSDNMLSGATSFGGGAGLAAFSRGSNNYIEVEQSQFLSNSGGLPGALYLETRQNGGLESHINHCHFFENEAQGYGAGLSINTEAGAISSNHVIENCTVDGNRFIPSSSQKSGAGIGITSSIANFETTIRNCAFTNNQNPDGGAAIEVFPTLFTPIAIDVRVENSLFTEHDNGQAVLKLNFLGASTLNNLTLADNDITALEIINGADVLLRNSIIESADVPAVDVSPTSTLTSLGGNLVSDSSATAHLTPQDVEGANPRFEGTGDHPYQIRFDSPAVDLGIFYAGFDPTALDMAGNIRFQGMSVDAGAYESSFTTSNKDQLVAETAIQLYPVPVQTAATLELKNEWRGEVKLQIFNAIGQQVHAALLQKSSQHAQWNLDMNQFPTGRYQLLLTSGNARTTKAFVLK